MAADNVIFCESLHDAFNSVGLPYPVKEPEAGKLSRFSTNGKSGDLAGWIKLFPDGAGAAFGCNRDGSTYTWQQRDSNAPPMSQADKQALQAKANAIRLQVEKERTESHAKASKTANRIFSEALENNKPHDYIKRKGIKPIGVKLDLDGRLVLPVHDASGAIQSLQFIDAKGEKRFLPDGKMQGGRLFLGAPADGLPLILCEGWATGCSLREATSMVVVVGFSGSNLKHVASDIARQFPRSKIIVAGDLDAHGKGLEYANKAVKAATGAVMALPRFTDGREAGDFNDLHHADGLEVINGLISQAIAPHSRYKLLNNSDLAALPPIQWRIKNILPASGLAAVFGASGSGKSFLVLDMLQSLADGRQWFDCRVKPCNVVYIALEGEAGLAGRVKAYSMRHGNASENIRYMVQPFNLLAKADIIELAQVIKAVGGGGVVVLDTLNRAAPGTDENDSKSMGEIIAGANHLQRLIGGLVLLVHHTGKDASKGLRGHSSLHAALDAAIEVRRNGEQREWLIAKSKDGEDGQSNYFGLEIVELGRDEDNEPITSCVIRAIDASGEMRKTLPPNAGNQKIAYDTLKELLKKAGDRRPQNAPAELPKGRPCIELTHAISEVGKRLIIEVDKRRTERTQAAITGLVNKGLLAMREGFIWLV
jgi:putative DNA primase/helicase